MIRTKPESEHAELLRQVAVYPGFVAPALCADVIDVLREIGRSDNGGVRKTATRLEVPCRMLRDAGPPEVERWLQQFRIDARDELSGFYGVDPELHVEFSLFSEMLPGDSHPRHADAVKPGPFGLWVPNHTPWRAYTAMLYLNTCGEDYGGGCLRFPGIGREIVPSAGLFVGFTCGGVHEHEVAPVEWGSRYAISIWTTHDPSRAERWE